MFNSPEPKKEDKPKHRILMEAIAISRYVDAKGKCPNNKNELVAWVKSEYGDSAEVA